MLPWSEIGELTAEIDAWQQAGGTHVSIVTMGRGLDSVDGQIDLLSTLAGALGRPTPSSSPDVMFARDALLTSNLSDPANLVKRTPTGMSASLRPD